MGERSTAAGSKAAMRTSGADQLLHKPNAGCRGGCGAQPTSAKSGFARWDGVEVPHLAMKRSATCGTSIGSMRVANGAITHVVYLGGSGVPFAEGKSAHMGEVLEIVKTSGGGRGKR